jgi:hypothetical protein
MPGLHSSCCCFISLRIVRHYSRQPLGSTRAGWWRARLPSSVHWMADVRAAAVDPRVGTESRVKFSDEQNSGIPANPMRAGHRLTAYDYPAALPTSQMTSPYRSVHIA